MGNCVAFPTVHADVPRISLLRGDSDRPRFSVMLPTLEPGDMLRRSLQSVLAQALSAEHMQIAVVDDGSRRADVMKIVRSVDPTGRVEVYVGGPHLGIGGNWNRAIGLARGHLIHLLHQDDMVLPGFYRAMDRAFVRAPAIGMAFCRSRIMDALGRPIKTCSRQRWWPGVLRNWLPRIAIRQRIQTPAAVVARSTYELLGGYRTDLQHTLDWEMWVRIAAHMPVWHDPVPLAIFRRHAASTTSRLAAAGVVWTELTRTVRINADSFPTAQKDGLMSASARWYAGSALRECRKQFRKKDLESAVATLAHARRLIALIGDATLQRTAETDARACERRLLSCQRAA